tara:strand:+ start:1769 stop:2065 length:297 start_codon:yes stop_codon:yes gene_type:complete
VEILKKEKIKFNIIEYLKTPLNIKDLKSVIKRLDLNPIDIIRKKDKLFKELQIDIISENEKILDIIVKNPRLLERPIVTKEEKAVIARPPELLYDFIK